MERLFWNFFLIFCDYKKKVGMKLILYFVLESFEVLITEKMLIEIALWKFWNFSVAHDHEKLGNSKIYFHFFT